MTLFEIPDFLESAFQEQLVRDAAFLGLTDNVSGFIIEPLTLRRYMVLKLAESPLLGDEPAGPYDVGQFLWVMSPKYRPGNCLRRRLFLRVKCRRLIRDRDFLIVMATRCRSIVRDALVDCSRGGGIDRSYWSAAASTFWRLRQSFTKQQVLDMPLAELFQYLKLKDAEEGRTVSNPLSDGAIARWQREQNDPRRTSN